MIRLVMKCRCRLPVLLLQLWRLLQILHIFGQVIQICDSHEVQIVTLVRLGLILDQITARERGWHLKQVISLSLSRLHHLILFKREVLTAWIFPFQTQHLFLMYSGDITPIFLINHIIVNQWIVPQNSYGLIIRSGLCISAVSLILICWLLCLCIFAYIRLLGVFINGLDASIIWKFWVFIKS